jgi:hypothetical protein
MTKDGRRTFRADKIDPPNTEYGSGFWWPNQSDAHKPPEKKRHKRRHKETVDERIEREWGTERK